MNFVAVSPTRTFYRMRTLSRRAIIWFGRLHQEHKAFLVSSGRALRYNYAVYGSIAKSNLMTGRLIIMKQTGRMVAGLKIPVVIASFIAALLAILITQRALDIQGTRFRFTDELTGLDGVEDVELEDTNTGKLVVVRLGNVSDIGKIYMYIHNRAVRSLGDNFGGIMVVDNRTAELDDIYYRMHFAIQEGISTGRFTTMITKIEEITRRARVDRYRVDITNEYVFVQLHKDNHNLYEVVPRPPIMTLLQANSMLKLNGGES